MKITINNVIENLSSKNQFSITDILEYKKFSFKMLVIKLNGKLIKKDKYNSTYVKEGDILDIIHLISGG